MNKKPNAETTLENTSLIPNPADELTEEQIEKLREFLRIIIEDKERGPLYQNYGVFNE